MDDGFPPDFLAGLEPENQELIKNIMADAKNGTLEKKATAMAMATKKDDEEREQNSMLFCGNCKILVKKNS